MEIVLDGFILEVPSIIGKYSKFNLFTYTIVQEGKHKGRRVKREQWYDCTIEKAIGEIIRIRMESQYKGDNVDLETFLERFKEISNATKVDIDKIQKSLDDYLSKSNA